MEAITKNGLHIPLKLTTMKQTGHITDEPIGLYSDYRSEVFTKSQVTLDAVLDNIAAGSLRVEDKKLLLVKMMQTIQFEILTKF